MADRSAIEWTDTTWNPVTGCDRVSPGCDNCYALTLAKRLKGMGSARYQADGDPRTSGPGFGVTCHPDKLGEPLRWRKPRRVFVNSMSDLFHPDVPDEFVERVWDAMAHARAHSFQILTKRPQRMADVVGRIHDCDHGGSTSPACSYCEPLPNVWLGTSIETDRYTFRADHLRATPAAVRFLSLEPLLGPLPSLNLDGIHWVIVGGESGPKARPMHPDWVREIRDRCVAAGIPLFMKQWGEWQDGSAPAGVRAREAVVTNDGRVWPWGDLEAALRDARLGTDDFQRLRPVAMAKVGKHFAGRELDDRTWDEYPA